MFDKVTFAPQARTEYVTREVHEHRAPTDQSVKLLMEMEAAAAAKVERSVVVADNTFACVIHRLREPLTQRVLLRAIFTMNGKHLTADASAEFVEDDALLVDRLREAVGHAVAGEILAGATLVGL